MPWETPPSAVPITFFLLFHVLLHWLECLDSINDIGDSGYFIVPWFNETVPSISSLTIMLSMHLRQIQIPFIILNKNPLLGFDSQN